MRRPSPIDGSNEALPDSLTPSTPSPAGTALAPAMDAAKTVFGFAPLWVHSATWHCRHPDSSNEQSYLDTVGPNTTDEVSRLYKNRQMKGSNLVVGLASDVLPAEQIPASFFRTLGYLFEMAKSGLIYAPVTQADLERGSPAPDWCPPLWQNQSRSQPSDAGSIADSQSEAHISSGDGDGRALDAAERLLHSSPYWCYLYNHEPSRSKKTPPKTSEEMITALRGNCLPDWAPLVGLGKDVATFNSLPPCLFMTLGSLANLVAAGVTYKPVGLVELNRYDKFFNSRTKWGSTQGVLQPLAPTSAGQQAVATPPPSAVIASTIASRVSAPAAVPTSTQPYSSSGLYAMHQQPGPANPTFMPYNQPMPMGPNPMMWYGSYPGYIPSQMYAGMPMQHTMAMPADSGHAHSLSHERSSAPEMVRGSAGSMDRSSSGPISVQMSCPLPGERAGAGQQGDESRGQWQTPVFRLFMTGYMGSRPGGHWWLLVPGPVAGSTISGPLSSEEIILHFASGRLRDHHYVCGATVDVPGYMLPTHLFEPIGKLLQQQVDGKSSYSLRTTDELVGFNNPESEDRSSFPGRYRGGKGAVGGLSMRRSHKSMDGQGPMAAGGSRNG